MNDDMITETDGPKLLDLLVTEEEQQIFFDKLEKGHFDGKYEAFEILEANLNAGVEISDEAQNAFGFYCLKLQAERDTKNG